MPLLPASQENLPPTLTLHRHGRDGETPTPPRLAGRMTPTRLRPEDVVEDLIQTLRHQGKTL